MAVPPDDLTCEQLVELVTDYLEGSLPAAEAARFDAHLGHCPECRNHVDDLRTTIELVGRVSRAALSPAAEATLIAAFRGWRSRIAPADFSNRFRRL